MSIRLFAKHYFFYLVAISVIIMTMDYFTGDHIQLVILYVLPVGLAAWNGRLRMAYGFSVLFPIARLFFHIPWEESISDFVIVNAVLRIVALLVYAYFIHKAQEAATLRKKLDSLENILPICAYCKKIRNEKGDYEALETYISSHSQAQFTHGICPECAQKLFPEPDKPDKNNIR